MSLSHQHISIRRKLRIPCLAPVLLFATIPSGAKQDNIKDMHVHEVLTLTATVNALAWSRDGSRLAALHDYGSQIEVFGSARFKSLVRISRESNFYVGKSMAFIADSKLIVSAPKGTNDTGAFEILDLIKTDQRKYVGQSGVGGYWHNSDTFQVSIPTMQIAGIPAGKADQAKIYDAQDLSLKSTCHIPRENGAELFGAAIDIAPTGDIAVGASGGGLFVFDRSCKLKFRRQFFGNNYIVSAVRYNGSGTALALGGRVAYGSSRAGTSTVSILSFPEHKDLWQTKKTYKHNVNSLEWKNDGLLMIGGIEGLSSYDLFSRELSDIVKDIAGEVWAMAVSAKGRLAVSSGNRIYIMQ